MGARCGRVGALLGCEQPPGPTLATVGELELDLAGGQRLDRPVVKRRVGAAEAGDQLRTIGQSLEHLSKRFSRLTPCDEVIAQERDGISGVKAAAHVVGSGWS